MLLWMGRTGWLQCQPPVSLWKSSSSSCWLPSLLLIDRKMYPPMNSWTTLQSADKHWNMTFFPSPSWIIMCFVSQLMFHAWKKQKNMTSDSKWTSPNNNGQHSGFTSSVIHEFKKKTGQRKKCNLSRGNSEPFSTNREFLVASSSTTSVSASNGSFKM